VSAHREATARGAGAASLDNRMIDEASIRMARTTLKQAGDTG
jgi:citrate lyase beta subunit